MQEDVIQTTCCQGRVRTQIGFTSGIATGDVAVILIGEGNQGEVWVNRQHVQGARLNMVELWARRAVARGWRFDVLWAEDIDRLMG